MSKLRFFYISLAATIFVAFAAFSAPLFQSATQVTLPAGLQFTNAGRQLLSISADGTQVVFVANNTLYVRGINEKDAKIVPGFTATGAVTNPVFSPDGKSIAYWSGQDQSLKRVPVAGGSATTICQAANPYGMSWSADDTILFGQGASGIRRVKASGGMAETIVTVKKGEFAHGPQMLPGGDALLYTLATAPQTTTIPPSLQSAIDNARARGQTVTPEMIASALASLNSSPDWDTANIVVQSLKTNEPKTLVEGGTDARFVAQTGHLVFARADKLLAVRFSPQSLVVSGSPATLLQGVRNAGGSTGTSQFSFSNTGTLVYISTATTVVANQRQMAFVDMTGKVTNLRHVPASLFGPRISPDGKQVAYRDGGAVWIADLSSEAPHRQLTTEPGEGPIWSPDGKRIAYISIYNGNEALYWRSADGTGVAERLADRARAPESWSDKLGLISYITLVGPSGDGGDYDIWTISPQDRKPTPLIVIPPSAQSGSRYSPDGKWLAYESNESGRAEIYVESIPRSAQRYQISKTGGARPLWAPDGSTLYYDNNGGNNVRLISVSVQTQPKFSWGEPQTLPITGFVQPSGTIRRQYDITPDGKQFLVTFPPQPAPSTIDTISNWFDKLLGK